MYCLSAQLNCSLTGQCGGKVVEERGQLGGGGLVTTWLLVAVDQMPCQPLSLSLSIGCLNCASGTKSNGVDFRRGCI